MFDPELVAETVAGLSSEKGLPLVVLGGAADDSSDVCAITRPLRDAGVRFTHANDLFCLPRAVYFIGEPREQYRDYLFSRGSVVVDLFDLIEPLPGVEVVAMGQVEDSVDLNQ